MPAEPRPRLLATAKFRFALLYAGLFMFSVLALGWWLLLSLRQSLEAQARLHIEAETAQLLVDYRDDGLEELRHDIRERIDHHPPGRLYYAIVSADGRSIFDPLQLAPGEGWQRLPGPVAPLELLVKVSRLEQGYRLAVGSDLAAVRELQAAWRKRVLLALGLSLLVAVAGGLWLSHRFLARVDRLGRSAERIGAGMLSERLVLSGSGDDFDQLAGTINRMLERIEELVGDLRQVSTNIAHDLRTPLGQLRNRLESLAATAEREQQARIEAAIEVLDGILASFAALLRIAEIDAGARRAGFRPVPLSALLDRLVEPYQAVAEAQDQQLRAELGPGLVVNGDPELLFQLFANLLENALRHAGPGTAIQLRLWQQDGQVRVVVRDDGPGIPAAARAEMLKPFARLDRSRSSPGSGLGLSVVAAIARLHEASLELADGNPGLQVTLGFNHAG